MSARFREPLVYGRPSAAAWAGWTLLSLVLGGYGIRGALYVLDLVADRPSRVLEQCVGVLGFAALFAIGIKCARAKLVLGRDRAKIPHLLGWRAIGYDDVASYDLERTVVSLGGHGKIKAQVLTIRSKRADVAPLGVLVPDSCPLDPALLARLDRVIQAGRDSA